MNQATPMVSIIVAYHNEKYFKTCFEGCKNINYPNYEVIFVSDRKITIDDPKFQIIYTNKTNTSPAEKNDLGILSAKGDICAFINDDVVPRSDWLTQAVPNFHEEKITAVGGPGITPKESTLQEIGSGTIYSTFLGAGPLRHRYIPTKRMFVEDYPTYNLLVRKEALINIGGFNSTFYGGEDTKLCLRIIDSGGTILYDPKVIVYHYRRPLFLGHMKQVWNVAKHRGYFMKKFPQTSLKLTYFLPSFFMLFSLLTFITPIYIETMLKPILIYYLILFAACFISGLTSHNFIVALMVMLGIPLSHFTYGLGVLKGLTTKTMDR